MTALESPRYQAARDRIKGNPVIIKVAAGVATVPLAGLAHKDGTPRFESFCTPTAPSTQPSH